MLVSPIANPGRAPASPEVSSVAIPIVNLTRITAAVPDAAPAQFGLLLWQ